MQRDQSGERGSQIQRFGRNLCIKMYDRQLGTVIVGNILFNSRELRQYNMWCCDEARYGTNMKIGMEARYVWQWQYLKKQQRCKWVPGQIYFVHPYTKEHLDVEVYWFGCDKCLKNKK